MIDEDNQSFVEKYGKYTVAQIQELNEKARLTCEWETTSQTEE